MSNITLDEMVPLLTREAASRRGTLLAIFVVISLTLLIVAFFWQKKYTSYVQMYVDDQRIVAPIVGAETGISRDQANVAREELFSAEIMDRILDDVGFADASTSAVERDRLKKDIIEDTQIHNINNQLIEIVYWHSDPRTAFETVSRYADLFLAKTMRTATEETTGAFEFIVDQVETYRNKLEDAEARLESFRSQYPGVSATTEGNVDQRIIELRRRKEETQLQFAQAQQRRKSLSRELSSESSTIVQDYQAGQIRDNIANLQAEVDLLRLSYTDDYPDILRLKQQIADYTKLAVKQREQVKNASGSGQSIFNLGGGAYSGASNLSPVYQQLRSDLARTSAEADSLRSRLKQLSVMLKNEVERSVQSSRVERELTQLLRDYQINKELFEDLLRRQESARLSMTLGAEKQGVLYRISEPAVYPYIPTGLRFIHIAFAGLILGTIMPFLYLFVFLKLDPRIRTASSVTEVLELPLLTTVPHMRLVGEKPGLFSRPAVIFSVIAGVVGLYIVVALAKVTAAQTAGGGSII